MEVLILTLFVSLILAGAGVGFFVWSIRTGSHEHADRLALLPIESEETTTPRSDPSPDAEAPPPRSESFDRDAPSRSLESKR